MVHLPAVWQFVKSHGSVLSIIGIEYNECYAVTSSDQMLTSYYNIWLNVWFLSEKSSEKALSAAF